jgi:hypothetical protein
MFKLNDENKEKKDEVSKDAKDFTEAAIKGWNDEKKEEKEDEMKDKTRAKDNDKGLS